MWSLQLLRGAVGADVKDRNKKREDCALEVHNCTEKGKQRLEIQLFNSQELFLVKGQWLQSVTTKRVCDTTAKAFRY